MLQREKRNKKRRKYGRKGRGEAEKGKYMLDKEKRNKRGEMCIGKLEENKRKGENKV